MAQHKDNMPRHSDKKLTLLAVFVLLLTVSCLILTMWAQDSSYQEEQPVAVAAAPGWWAVLCRKNFMDRRLSDGKEPF